MPTSQQRKNAARRHLERQRQAREQQRARNRRTTLIVTAVGTAIAVAIGLTFLIATGNEKSQKAPKGFVSQVTTGPCGYHTANQSLNPNLRDVGMPPDPAPTPRSTLTVRFTTNRGVIEAQFAGEGAPCNVQAIAYLIDKHFYDNTPCPRIASGSINIVQCGSGGATTAGGPTFTLPDENLADASYTPGAIAMANVGRPNTASSQFFFITQDSNEGLAKSYTVVGHVTKGLDILQTVNKGGDDGSAGAAGGGKPKLSLIFKTVRVIAVSGGATDPGLGASPSLSAAPS